MEGKLYPTCHRCGEVPPLGLYDGLRIRGRFFCSSCEREFITVKIDSEDYLKVLFSIREALFAGQGRRRVIDA